MKPFWKDVIYACIMGLIVPALILNLGVLMLKDEILTAEPTIAEVHQDAPKQMIKVLHGGEPQEMELESYLVGVVLGEMPASFEPEALKAQAVVARTYTMRAANGKSKHEGAAVCTDSNCCQSYTPAESYLARGGAREGIEKITNAVMQTAGQVLTYEGELIEATYFSCSGGQTEDAVAVWGADVPYLQSVASPGEEHAAHHTDTVQFELDEFLAALSLASDKPPKEWFSELTRTEGGGVASVRICGKLFRGTELRKLLGLRSTAFSVEAGDESITITTRGFGHRVGMSQYGADAMAASGSTYEQILSHYYSGTNLDSIGD